MNITSSAMLYGLFSLRITVYHCYEMDSQTIAFAAIAAADKLKSPRSFGKSWTLELKVIFCYWSSSTFFLAKTVNPKVIYLHIYIYTHTVAQVPVIVQQNSVKDKPDIF